MESNGWITDRLPTAEDADILGYVWVWDKHNVAISEQYKNVLIETPWAPKVPPPPYVKQRWKPKEGEKYWYAYVDSSQVHVTFHVTLWGGYGIDERRYDIGNCFQTKEEGEEVFNKIKQLLKEYHDGK